MRPQNSTWCCAALALIALGCSSDDSEQDMDPVSGGGAGAAAGSAGGGRSGSSGAAGASAAGSGAGGGAGTSAAGSGGSAASSGGGGATAGADASVAGEHCSPGTVYRRSGDGPSVVAVATRCDSRDVDGDGEDDHIDAIALPEPMRPGESYAFSGTFETGWIEAELWGTDSECGEPIERLASGRIDAGAITCFTMNPTTAHQSLLWVWTFGGGSVSEFAICPTGSCAP